MKWLLLVLIATAPGTTLAQLGPARAGSMAQAENAATAGTNPAGLTRVAEEQWVVGAMVGYSDNEFDVKPPPASTVAGGDPRNKNEFFGIPTLFYSRPLGEEFRVGFAFSAPLGISSDYGDSWSGRYLANESSLFFLSFSPVGAWRVNEKLSLGATLSLTYSESETTTSVANLLDPVDGSVKTEMSGWGIGGGVSALWEHSSQTRFGLGYTFPTDTELDGTPRWSNIGPGLQAGLEAAGVFNQKIDLEMTLPQRLAGGFYHEFSDELALMGDLVWFNFSEFGKVDISVGPVSTTVDGDYRDIWAGTIGIQYSGWDEIVGSAGIAYISSGVSDSNRTLAFPWDEFWIFGVGLERQLTPTVRLHSNLLLAVGGDGEIDQTDLFGRRLVGEFDKRRSLLLDVTFVWSR